MKENPYFKEEEFRCKCGKCTLPKGVPSDELVDLLCEVRKFFKSPVIINSGYRCASHNAKVGGAKQSQHTIGSAADFIVEGIQTQEVHKHCLKVFGNKPLGIAIKINPKNKYGGFVHLDTRGKRARWEYK